MEFNKVINGLVRYINKEIMPNMNSWQEAVARIAMARFMNNQDNVRAMLTENPIIKTFAIFDENGDMDAEGLMCDIKSAVREKGFIEFDLPMFGHFKFDEADVDTLHSYIRGS